MKVVSGLLMLVVLVTGIAVHGSRAQPLYGTSVAFQQCLGGVREPGHRCTSPASPTAGHDIGGDRAIDQVGDTSWTGSGDGWSQGENFSDPDFWKEVLVAAFGGFVSRLAERVADWAADRFFGGGLPTMPETGLSPMIFDPVR